MKTVIFITIVFLSGLQLAWSELGIFSVGYDFDTSPLANGVKLERRGLSGMYGAIYYPLQLPRPLPSARWIWLSPSYSYYRGETETAGFELSMHNFRLSSSLYVDLLDQLLFLNQLVLFVGAGAGAVRAEAAGGVGISGGGIETKQWQYTGHATLGIAGALVGRFGPQIQLTYRLPKDYDIDGVDVVRDKVSFQVGIAYIPDEDDFLLNW